MGKALLPNLSLPPEEMVSGGGLFLLHKRGQHTELRSLVPHTTNSFNHSPEFFLINYRNS